MISFISKNKLVFVIALWFLLSPFYYFSNFYTGDLISELDVGLFHRLLKYVVAALICILILLNRPNLIICFLYLFFSVCLLLFLFLGLEVFDTRIQIALLLVFVSFSGFMLLPSYLTDDQLNLILNSVVLSALFVSFISFYEYFYMWPVLGDYWRATGGYRSVSTMLNPNNLGVYLGASLLILLLYSKFTFFLRFSAIIIITCALLMSGSRTAIVSTVISLLFGLFFSQRFKVRLSYLLCFIIFLIVLFGFLVFVLMSGYLISDRYFNLETAFIRLDKYFSYLSMFDSSYFFPDFNFERSFM